MEMIIKVNIFQPHCMIHRRQPQQPRIMVQLQLVIKQTIEIAMALRHMKAGTYVT